MAERRFDALPAGRERAFASALFYGVLERELTLRHILRRYSKKPPEKLDPEVLTALEMGLNTRSSVTWARCPNGRR